MKKLIPVLIIFIFSYIGFAGTICVKLPQKSSDKLYQEFAKELKNYSEQHYGVKNFSTDSANKTIKGERVFKVKRRRRPLIGTTDENFRKKPKWKKEKIEIIGKINNNEACVTVNLTAYNKRTRKWHTLKTDNMLEEHMAAFVLSKTLKGTKVWSIGNISIEQNGATQRVLNLTQFTVESVDISVDPDSGIKSVNFLLVRNGETATYKVLMLGEVKDINGAMKAFNSHFLKFDPRKKISKIYDFYWAYAERGNIMDGMHKLQVITALGYPLKIEKKNDNTEFFVYNFDGKIYKYRIVKNELSNEID